MVTSCIRSFQIIAFRKSYYVLERAISASAVYKRAHRRLTRQQTTVVLEMCKKILLKSIKQLALAIIIEQAKTSDSKRQLDTNDHSDESRKRSQTTNEDSRRLLDIYDHSKDSKNDHKRFKAYERRLQNITPNDGSEDARMTPSDQKRNVVMHDIRTVCRYPKALQTHKHTHIQIDFESGILKA